MTTKIYYSGGVTYIVGRQLWIAQANIDTP